ncbi:hypothetical protein [Streptomyces sp. NPDC056600]|uniref:hypothetical protein n=1 Tax=Streptomyces sp. NPDC056600 TaxID=3345874 RepID=UPI003683A61E
MPWTTPCTSRSGCSCSSPRLGIRLWRIPLWLVTVLVLGGFLLADSILAPAVNALIK